jgi:hypothetical protein
MISIEQGESSPLVNIDTEKNLMVLKGNSFTSNPVQFYNSVINWGKTYIVQGNAVFRIEITMGYYSTSNIQLLNLFFKSLHSNNKGKVELTFFLNTEEEEDLDETILSLTFNTGLQSKRVYLNN